MVCHALVARPAVDDAAIFETFFNDGPSHGHVVAVCVDADVVVLVHGELHNEMEYAFKCPAAGNAVYGGIGLFIQPFTVVNDAICRVGTFSKHKGGFYISVFPMTLGTEVGFCLLSVGTAVVQRHHIAVSALNVFFYQLPAGIVWFPLVRIAVFLHKCPCVGKYFL